jgi:uncharacterized damage-inducible protein DinB
VSPGSPSPRMNLLARSIVFRWDYFIMQDSISRTVAAVTPGVLRDHIEYTAWASRRLVDAAAQLSPDALTRDFQTADHSVLGTLAHIYASDRLWLSRLTCAPFPGFVTDADRTLATLQNDWPALHGHWEEWAATLTDEGAHSNLDYKDLKGNHWRQPVWQLVLHVVNHATHHRGQVSGFLRALGHTPPALDLIAYYRR